MNSRRKGAKNERVIADLFTQWTGKKFAKTPASGGLQWKSSFSKGDIVCTKEGHYFPFCIEAKFHDKIDFSHLLTPRIKNIEILSFWEQCKRDARKCNKVPLLFMRYNGLPKNFYFLVMDERFMSGLWQFFASKVNTTSLCYNGKYNLRILRSTEFFKLDYKSIKEYAKAYNKKEPKEKFKK